MLKPATLGLYLALFLCCPITSAEAGLNKCTDGKHITYTIESCEKEGLTSAGPIKDAVTIVPVAPKTKSDPSEKSAKDNGEGNDIHRNKTPKNDDSGTDAPKEATVKPVSPLVNKLLNW